MESDFRNPFAARATIFGFAFLTGFGINFIFPLSRLLLWFQLVPGSLGGS